MSLKNQLKSQKKKAFTPALKKVKEQAKAVSCASNLKQWNIIMSFFAADNNDEFPDADHDDGSHGDSHGQWWLQPILPYVENHEILICPKAQRHPPDTGANDIHPDKEDECWGSRHQCNCNDAVGQVLWSSYAPNAWIMNPHQGMWGSLGIKAYFWGKLENITTPARVPFYLDARWVDAWPHHTDIPPDEQADGSHTGYMNTYLMTRHNKAINGVFFDGSARRVGLREFWRLKWHRAFNTADTTVNLYVGDNPPWPPWMK